MNLSNIEQMEVIYFLDRAAGNVNDPDALIVEMEIIEEDGEWIAYAEQGPEDIQFKLDDDLLAQITEGERQYLFESRTEARAHYNYELKKEKQTIQTTPRNILLQQFFDKWQGETVRDTEVLNAMKAKIKAEFGVDV
ncbi:hypothetical protein RKD55_004592 [Rossellomorea marisflavi]